MSERREIHAPPREIWAPETWTMRRRELLQAGAGLALAAALAGCGIGPGIRGDVNRVIEPKVDGDLYYFNYSQYINPALVKEFEKRYDVRVIESYFDSMEGMLAKLRAGNAYDVMFPTAEYVQRLDPAGAVAADSARQAREPRQHLRLFRRSLVRPRLGALGARTRSTSPGSATGRTSWTT